MPNQRVAQENIRSATPTSPFCVEWLLPVEALNFVSLGFKRQGEAVCCTTHSSIVGNKLSVVLYVPTTQHTTLDITRSDKLFRNGPVITNLHTRPDALHQDTVEKQIVLGLSGHISVEGGSNVALDVPTGNRFVVSSLFQLFLLFFRVRIPENIVAPSTIPVLNYSFR